MHHHEPDGTGIIDCILLAGSLPTTKGNIMIHNLDLANEIDIDQSELNESGSEMQLAVQNANIYRQETLHCGYMPPYRTAYMSRNSGVIEC